MRKIKIQQVVIPILTPQIRDSPMPVGVTLLMKDTPKGAQLIGGAQNGKAYFEIREKTWITTD